MQNYALSRLSPLSIAWFVRPDDWDQIEQVVYYNTGTLGGYFNVLVPLDAQDEVPHAHQHFLKQYDADFIVLAPGMQSIKPVPLGKVLYPFACIPWEKANLIADQQRLDSRSTLHRRADRLLRDGRNSPKGLVAVADEQLPDRSRFAFVACGDVQPHPAVFFTGQEGNEVNLIRGYREKYLVPLLRAGRHWNDVTAIENLSGEGNKAPNRTQLASIIDLQNAFPLSSAVQAIQSCCEIQDLASRPHHALISLSADYIEMESEEYWPSERSAPLILLASENFGGAEACLFWNLRASGSNVAWLSFDELDKEGASIARWLDTTGRNYALTAPGPGVVFTASSPDMQRLQSSFERLQQRRPLDYPEWSTCSYESLITYGYSRPYRSQEHLLVAQDEGRCTLLPNLPPMGLMDTAAITLEWDRLMTPPSSRVVETLISQSKVSYGTSGAGFTCPRVRITGQRHLRYQIWQPGLITFRNPTGREIVGKLFEEAGFVGISPSDKARYQLDFIQRAGGLEEAERLLRSEPYRTLFQWLADTNDNRKDYGLVLKDLGRRAFHHKHILDLLRITAPLDVNDYANRRGWVLPDPIIELLHKDLLERGFLLQCAACSLWGWYPLDEVGQTFKCKRCYQTQLYTSNPLLLYKLPEVVFQGFNTDMIPPLLALASLRRKSKRSFEWVEDSDVPWSDGKKRNMDIIALIDGKLHIGEAKSNDGIDGTQLRFYEELTARLQLDGLVFATSAEAWRPGTQTKLDELKQKFAGERVILTRNDLYSVQESRVN